MVMDKGEILRNYNQAKYKTEQVRILADLNECTPSEIIDVLIEQGLDRIKLGRVIGRISGKGTPKKAPVAVLEEREITVEEAIERLRRERDELEKRQAELDREKEALYSKISGLMISERVPL